MTRRALITGATGFIGGRLAAKLVDLGWTVHALVRPSSNVSALPAALHVHVFEGSARQLAALAADIRPDVTFHLASLYVADHAPEQVETLIAANVLFPVQLAQALSDLGPARLVNAGTASQHSQGPGYAPASLYAATKQACEDLLRYFHDVRDLSVVTLKIFDTYGPGDPRRKLLQLLVDAASSGEELALSPGDQVIDLTHVDDVVEAFVIGADLMLGSSEKMFQDCLLSGERYSVRALVPIVQSAIERPLNVRFGARPYRAREIMMPVEAGADQRLQGWAPSRNLRASLPSLLRD